MCLSLLFGCSATMIQSPTTAYGPSEGKKIGQILYDPHFKKSQEDAYRQMYEACDGKYRILSQQLKSMGEETTYDAYTDSHEKIHAKKTTTSQEYMHITFECLENDNSDTSALENE
jgi:hypothetical protein